MSEYSEVDNSLPQYLASVFGFGRKEPHSQPPPTQGSPPLFDSPEDDKTCNNTLSVPTPSVPPRLPVHQPIIIIEYLTCAYIVAVSSHTVYVYIWKPWVINTIVRTAIFQVAICQFDILPYYILLVFF